jgi:Ca-activated chloride channel family protein
MIEFAWPYVFAALPMPLLVALLTRPASQQPRVALRVPFFAAIPKSVFGRYPGRPWLRRVLSLLVWLLLVSAAGRPQFVGEPVNLPITGRDLLLAIDISGSMDIEDMQLHDRLATRLEVVKVVAGDFIQRRVGDRIGLILFGAQPYLQTPLTFDRTTVSTLLGEATVGLAGKETAIGDGIGLAIKRLQHQKSTKQVLILLTDGANTAGEVSPLQAARLAAQAGLTIYTIGVGADDYYLGPGMFGLQSMNPATDLDEDTLKTIAQETGGRYFRARDTRTLMAIYQLLNELEPANRDEETFRPRQELYPWPLAAALLMTVILVAGTLPLGRQWRLSAYVR